VDLLQIIIIAVGLAMDACAVSLAAGASGRSRGKRAAFRLSFHFGLFQFLMPVIGWFGGTYVAGPMAAVDHWVAFTLLTLIGGRMIRSSLRDSDPSPLDPSRGAALIGLSLATSIDALAVGFSLAMLQVNIWQPSVAIGLVTAGLSLISLKLGSRLGARFGTRMELAGGILLILIGLRILIQHLSH
jgi:putative Mn2+ efflux pump MntP